MPDISLLQDDNDISVGSVNNIPGIFATFSSAIFVLSLLVYVGLFFYVEKINKDLEEVIVSMEGLTLENTSNALGRLNKIEEQKNVLMQIRKNHTDARSILSVVSGSVYPDVYYESASFDVKAGLAELKGVSFNSASLSGQVRAYNDDERISSYEIEDVSLGNDGINFIAKLKINSDK